MRKIISLLPILLIIIFSIYMRLDHLDRPLIDNNSFRQTLTLSIAKNFINEDFNIFNPRTDAFLNNQERLFLGEFPLYEYSLAVLFKLWGDSIILARIYSIILSALTAIAIYFIGFKLFNYKVGLISAIIYNLFPASLFWGRSILPEVFAVCLSTWAILLFLEESVILHLIASLLLGLSISTKPYFSVLLLPVGYWHFSKFKKKFSIKQLMLIGTMIIFINIIWLFRRLSIPVDNRYPISAYFHMYGLQPPLAFFFNTHFFEKIITNRILGQLMTPFGGILLFISIGGIIVGNKTIQKKFLILWIGSIFLYINVVGWGNLEHDYYQLIILPVVSLCIGYFIINIYEKIRVNPIKLIIVAVIFFFYFYYLGYLPFKEYIKEYYYPEVKYFEFQSDIQSTRQIIPTNDLVVILGGDTPEGGSSTLLSHIERKGWVFWLTEPCMSNEEMVSKINDYRFLGAKYFIFFTEPYYINTQFNCDPEYLFDYFQNNSRIIYQGNKIAVFLL